MPAAAFANFQAYGEAAGAMVADGSSQVGASIMATANVQAVTAGTGSMPFAKGTRLVNSPMVVSGVGSMPRALPKALARAGSIIKVNTLSQDDVTGAVLEAPVEGGLSLKQALRLLLSVAVGDATGLESGNPAFKSLDGSKNRIAGTYSGGTRSVSVRDGE